MKNFTILSVLNIFIATTLIAHFDNEINTAHTITNKSQDASIPGLITSDDMINFYRIMELIKLQANSTKKIDVGIELLPNKICLKEKTAGEQICLHKAILAQFLLEAYKRRDAQMLDTIEKAAEIFKNTDLPEVTVAVKLDTTYPTQHGSLNVKVNLKEASFQANVAEKNKIMQTRIEAYWKNNFSFTGKGTFNQRTQAWNNIHTSFESLNPEDQN